ncbi:hypothetical protein HOA93_00360 [bacterium]|nr:hypothetical protein [bacterium]
MILINIDLISSSSGIIHSKIVSLNSIDSSSTINAGSLVIFNSFFNSSSRVVSTFIKSTNPSSSNALLTLANNSFVFSSVQYNLIFIFILFLYVIIISF